MSVLDMIVECGRQLDNVNASDKNREIHLTQYNYEKLCKELDVKYCKWVDRFTIVVKIKK